MSLDNAPANTIVCTSDASCPAPYTCSVSAGRCVDPISDDVRGPQLLSASVSDPTTVTVVFDEVLDPATVAVSAFQAASKSFGTPLQLTSARVTESLLAVVLTTDPALPGIDYRITASGIADLLGNVTPSTTDYTGFGAYPERAPPELIAPANETVEPHSPTTLFFTPRNLANFYLVDVATDADFALPIPGSPFRAEASDSPSVSVPHTLDVRYYWRVRADTTTDGQYSASGTFNGFGDAIYVSCADVTRCDDSGKVGNATSPFETIERAVSTAKALGIHTVRVATPPNGTSLTQTAKIDGPISLLGGYTRSFSEAERDVVTNRTPITSSTSPVIAVIGATTPMVLEGFSIVSTGVGLQVAGASGGPLEIMHNTIQARVVVTNGASEPAAVELHDNTLASLSVIAAGMTARANTITGGVDASQLSNVVLTSSTIRTSSGCAVTIDTSLFALRGNRISGGDGGASSCGVSATGFATSSAIAGVSSIVNNIIDSGLSAEAAGIRFDGTVFAPNATFTVANNLIYARAPTGSGSHATSIVGGFVVYKLIDNIIFTTSGETRRCLDLTTSNARFIGNNLLFDCPSALFVTGGQSYTSIGDINTTNTGAAFAGGNITIAGRAELALQAFPDDVHLTASSPDSVRHGGLDTSMDACHTNNLNDQWYTCGEVFTDADNRTRTCPTSGACFSLGPYELDP